VPARITRWVALVAVALLAAACSSDAGGGPQGDQTAVPEGFNVFVASYDVSVAAAGPRRFIVGLTDAQNQPISYGKIAMRFAWLGEGSQSGKVTAEPTLSATGTFLPIPGSNPKALVGSDKPRPTPPSEARGVYAAQVAFDRPGYWGVEVRADLDGVGMRSGTSQFEVRASSAVPDVGQPALKTRNLVAGDVKGPRGVPASAIDSRAQGGARIPDPELHRTTIAAAIAAHRPAVVVFSTPVYCVSQFCGPVTDMVADLAKKYGDRAEFIHVEIWRDFQAKRLNDAAEQWLWRNDTGQEPWVFVIGADGRITARFDNVATRGELEPLLERLPRR
jgi:hypothetical protein